MSSRASPLLLLASFFALYVIWGSTYFAISIAVQSWPPMLMAGIRFVIAGGGIYLWSRSRGATNPSRRQWAAGSAVGVLLLTVGNGGVTIAEHLGVASGVAALAIATVPLFAVLFGMIWGQRAAALEWAGIALGLLGIVLLNLGSNMQSNPWGAALILLAAAGWAFGSMWGRHLPLPTGSMASAVQMLSGGVVLLLGSQLSGEHLQSMPTLAGWLALGYLILFGSIVAFSAYVYLLKHTRPAAATSYAYVNPVVAVLLGVGFGGEHIGIEEGLAMLVIVSAVVLIGLPQWRTPRKAAETA